MSWRDDIRTITIAGLTVISLVGFAWVIWQFAASNYKAQIESYDAQIKLLEGAFGEARGTFSEIQRKAEKLMEPQVWRIDTIEYRDNYYFKGSASNPLYMYGGLVRFSFTFLDVDNKRINGKYTNEVSGIPYHWDTRSTIEKIMEQNLHLTLDKERFEFSVDDERYYLRAVLPAEDNNLVVIFIYKLNPLYLPTIRETTDKGK